MESNNLTTPLVAHRLRTVIDYDRLIVLDKGQVSYHTFIHSSIAHS
jgi:ABC-type transport system involved in Fe-S cluster assembly fused permease/ATPase subunit